MTAIAATSLMIARSTSQDDAPIADDENLTTLIIGTADQEYCFDLTGDQARIFNYLFSAERRNDFVQGLEFSVSSDAIFGDISTDDGQTLSFAHCAESMHLKDGFKPVDSNCVNDGLAIHNHKDTSL